MPSGETDFVRVSLDHRVGCGRSSVTRIDGDLRRPYVVGKDDARVNAVDEHRPLVAGDVPVKLVESAAGTRREEKADRIAHAIADDDSAIRVSGTGNVDVVSTRPAAIHRLMFDDERLTGRVGDGAVLNVELGRAS